MIFAWAQLLPHLHSPPPMSASDVLANSDTNSNAKAADGEVGDEGNGVVDNTTTHAAETLVWFVEQRVPQLLAGTESVSQMMRLASREEGHGHAIRANLYLTTKISQGFGGGGQDEEGGLGGDGFSDGTKLHQLIGDPDVPSSVRSAQLSRQAQRSRVVQRSQRPPKPRPPPASPRKPPPLRIVDRGGHHQADEADAEATEANAGVGTVEFDVIDDGDVEMDEIAIPLNGNWGVLHVTCPTSSGAADTVSNGGQSGTRGGGAGSGAEQRRPHWPTIWQAATEFNGTLTSLCSLMTSSLTSASATADARGQFKQAVKLMKSLERTAVTAHSALKKERTENEAAALVNAARIDESSRRVTALSIELQRTKLLWNLNGTISRGG